MPKFFLLPKKSRLPKNAPGRTSMFVRSRICPDLRKGRLKVRSVLIQVSISIRQVLVTERSLQILRRTYQP